MVAGLGDDQLTAIVRHHHERLDGTGYPDGLRGAEIPLGARVIAVADTYDAIIAARPYRPAAPHKAALDTLRAESLTHLDPALVRAFRSCYSGRAPLAFWESLAAWMAAAHFLPHHTPSIPRRVSLRDVMATTVAATMAAVAAVAAPTAAPGGQRHPAEATQAAVIAVTPTHASQPMPRRARKRPAPVHAPRSARVVVHRPAPSRRVPPATHHLTQSPRLRRGTTPATGQTPPSPLTTGRTSPSTRPPAGTAHPPRPNPRPRPTSPHPPPTPVTNAPPPPPSSGARPPTPTSTPSPSTNPSTTPSSTPSPPPATSTTGHPPSKDACKNGGYVQYGFSNQGQCIAAVEHGG
jgi:hypothetical protein